MSDRDTSMAGRVCLVTGGTSGIGRECALQLAQRGGTVVIVGRHRERNEAVAAAVRRETGNPLVGSIAADLSSQAEVRRLAREFLDRNDRLHVLVNNAGALFELRQESVDGIEMTLAVNHLAPFLLTGLLMDTLRASGPSRIVNVSSDSHEMVKGFDFRDPEARTRRPRYGRSKVASALWTFAAPRAHPGLVQYAQTKLANLLFTYELARRLEGTGVTANALHPGFVATGFTQGNGVYGWFMRRWAHVFALSVEEGARTLVHLASSPEVDRVSGRYFVGLQRVDSSPSSRNVEEAQRLWRLSEELTGLAGRRAAE